LTGKGGKNCMICNKKEWAILDALQCVLYKHASNMTNEEKTVFNDFIYLCHQSTQDEKERRAKTAKLIAEKRKINKNYARGKKRV
jgi:hypothetical protein